MVKHQEEYNKLQDEPQKIIDTNDYFAALRVINNKGLLPYTDLSNEFGWKSNIILIM